MESVWVSKYWAQLEQGFKMTFSPDREVHVKPMLSQKKVLTGPRTMVGARQFHENTLYMNVSICPPPLPPQKKKIKKRLLRYWRMQSCWWMCRQICLSHTQEEEAPLLPREEQNVHIWQHSKFLENVNWNKQNWRYSQNKDFSGINDTEDI